MTDRERLTALLMAGAGDFISKNGALNCTKLADYLLEHGVIVLPETGIGDLSDGYHTFNELYHHRAVLFSVICNTFKDKAWKSKKHDTGDMFDGMFIVGIETPQGQATYHYDIEPYWDIFQAKELPNAPKWDGHTPEEAIRRISTLETSNVNKIMDRIMIAPAADVVEVVRCKDCLYATERYGHLTCINGISYCNHWNRPDDFCNHGVRIYGDTK